MVIMIAEVTVKAGMEREFLELIENDALHSEADEPGCLRFDVLQDVQHPAKYLPPVLPSTIHLPSSRRQQTAPRPLL